MVGSWNLRFDFKWWNFDFKTTNLFSQITTFLLTKKKKKERTFLDHCIFACHHNSCIPCPCIFETQLLSYTRSCLFPTETWLYKLQKRDCSSILTNTCVVVCTCFVWLNFYWILDTTLANSQPIHSKAKICHAINVTG